MLGHSKKRGWTRRGFRGKSVVDFARNPLTTELGYCDELAGALRVAGRGSAARFREFSRKLPPPAGLPPTATLQLGCYTAGMWPPSDKTEELAGAKAGDDDAVNRLIERRHRDGVRRLVQMRLDQRIQRRLDVSDVVQDVMVEVHRRLHDYLAHPSMAFHLWLRQIAKDRVIDAHRRHRVSGKRSVDREQPLLGGTTDDRSTQDLAAQLWDPKSRPASAAIRRKIARRVEAAVAELGEQDFEIIAMRHYEQVLESGGRPALGFEPAASMRYLRAVRKLRAILGRRGDGGRRGVSPMSRRAKRDLS